jgi:hypothetical protein
MEPEPQRKITRLVVGGILAAGLIGASFALTGWRWGLFCTGVALYEGWTLVNRYKEDTISETIWELSARPLIPLLFGLLTGWAAGSGYLGDPQVVGRAIAIGFLLGHFFFQRQPVPS